MGIPRFRLAASAIPMVGVPGVGTENEREIRAENAACGVSGRPRWIPDFLDRPGETLPVLMFGPIR